MRETVDINAYPPEVGADTIRRLAQVHAEGLRSSGSWSIKLPRDDPRITESMSILSYDGFSPWTAHHRPMMKGREYSVVIDREYDESDLSPCEYLILSSPGFADADPPLHNGCLRILMKPSGGSAFSSHYDFQSVVPWPGTRVVSDRVRKLLEDSGLKRVVFKPTFVIPAGKRPSSDISALPWDGFGDPWWELTSELTMPKLSPRAILLNNKGQRIADDFSDGCFLREGIDSLDALINPPEPTYRRSDIEALGEFDVAVMFEPMGGHPLASHHPLIVSNRFYRFCRKHKLKVNFVPVRIHD